MTREDKKVCKHLAPFGMSKKSASSPTIVEGISDTLGGSLQRYVDVNGLTVGPHLLTKLGAASIALWQHHT